MPGSLPELPRQLRKYAAFRAELDKRREYNKQFQPIDPMPYSHEMEKKNRRRKYKGGNQ